MQIRQILIQVLIHSTYYESMYEIYLFLLYKKRSSTDIPTNFGDQKLYICSWCHNIKDKIQSTHYESMYEVYLFKLYKKRFSPDIPTKVGDQKLYIVDVTT